MFMGTDTVVEVDRVSKIFSRQRQVMRERLGRDLRRVMLGRPFDARSTDLAAGEFFAVNEVSFSLKRGEAFGIIGLNGSGKTTLLRMLAGQLLPDGGQISVTGRTASMIDLTAGFEVNASGRDNVFLRGAALGRSRAEMQAAYQDIVDFAELGDAITAPVATYSSGMMMRLAFSIVSNTAPDLLFIDEVLAVGDFRFRQKCLARVREMRSRSAFVMVSHSMSDIMRFCDNAIVLKAGNVVFSGPSKEATEFFEQNIEAPLTPVAEMRLKSALGPQFANHEVISDVESYWCDAAGNRVNEMVSGNDLHFFITFRSQIAIEAVTIGIPMWNEKGDYAAGFSTDLDSKKYAVGAGEKVGFRLKIPSFPFNPGLYYSNLTILSGPEFLHRGANEPLTVRRVRNLYWGMVTLPHSWEKLD